MAKPQLENGFTKIANETMEALAKVNLSPYESRVLLVIFRRTYGWNKKADRISVSQISQDTGLAPSHVSRALSSLISRLIVTRTGNKYVGFQKNYDIWLQKLPVSVTNEEITGTGNKKGEIVTGIGNKKLPAEAVQNKGKTSLKESTDTLTGRTQPGNVPTIDILRRSRNFKDWLDYLNKSQNKVGLLLEAFNSWHKDAPDIDKTNTAGRIGQLFTMANRDAGFLLKVMWETAAADISGSHLNFIHGRLRSQFSGKKVSRDLPSAEELEQSWGRS